MNDDLKKKMKDLALSGALSGAVLGSGASFFNGAKSLGQILKSGAVGAGLAGSMSVGSGYLGNKLMGQDDSDDPNGNTKRGALGGAVAGGLTGGAIGIGLKNKTIKEAILKRLTEKEVVLKELTESSLLKRGVQAASKKPWLAALAAAGLIGAGASYQGADEGMQADFLQNLKRQKVKKEMTDD